MPRGRQLLTLCVMIIISIVLCIMLTANDLSGRGITGEAGDTFTASEALQLEELMRKYRTLDDLPGQLSAIKEETQALEVYITILEDKARGYRLLDGIYYSQDMREQIQSRFNLTPDGATSKKKQLNYAAYMLDYTMGYEEYCNRVLENIGKMEQISLFGKVNSRHMQKTIRDFSAKKTIVPKAISTLGVRAYLESFFGESLLLLLAVAAAVLFAAADKSEPVIGGGNKSLRWIYSGLLVLGMGLLLAAKYATVGKIWGLDCPEVPIQSVPLFRSSRYALTVGGLLVTGAILKILLGLAIFWACTAVLSLKKGYTVLTILAAAVFGLEIRTRGRNVGIHAVLQIEKGLGIYGNLSLFGFPVPTELFTIIVLLVFTLVSAYVLGKLLDRSRQVMREEAERRYFEDINSRYREIRGMRHDFHNHLSAFGYLLEQGKVEEAKAYLGEISEELEGTRLLEKTGIDSLDMILWNKVQQAKREQITISLQVDKTIPDTGLSEYELCSLFGNLLDNALDAVRKLDEGRRVVTLAVQRQLDMVCIFCSNPYLTVKREGNGFASMKADSRNHGLGIGQMRRIAEKHGGTLEISDADGEFKASILLQCRVAEK